MPAFTLRWGIISTGGIATKFVQDLLVDPSTRSVSDVAHAVAAVGSRSVASAEAFITKLTDESKGEPSAWGVEHGLLKSTKACGSYDDVFADPDVDAVYIGTPHTIHFAPAKAALLAGKHVLCEKPFTLDLAQLDELIAIAKEKKLFLMEAVWTRFHPIAYAVQDVLQSGKLGKIKRFAADFSMDFDPDSQPDSNRMVDPALGGGSLLDMGPYPSVWAMLAVHHDPANTDKNPRVVSSHQTVYKRSGVDSNSRWIVEWEGGPQAQLMTDMMAWGAGECTALVTCEKADLAIEYPPYRPQAFSIIPHEGSPAGFAKQRFEHPIPVGGGMQYEADEVARCIRDGRTESARMPLDESRVVQGWFDAVRTGGPTVLKDIKKAVGQ